MIAALAFLRRYWRELVLLAVMAGLTFVGWSWRGIAAERDAARMADAQDRARLALVQKQDAITQRIDASASATAEHTQIVYRTLTKEVTRYVASHPDACVLPADWLRLHNDAATERVSAAAGTVDATQ
ncbi:MAG: hypothetical protein JO171_12105 [Paludibacterium sp.]|uniref:hypothetical protein n=1 Tax=Paludibacterium sp. TaxID=1917523 RepID=UPI0025D24B6A|nr:hypothetical protein [Paludibacterium sp.]MBV8047894.1 hypothetical protein [Paludibacterium sp.]